MNASQRASCSSATHSFGWCACAMSPGPHMHRGIIARWNSDGLGAERHLADARACRCILSKRGDRAAVVRVESRQRRQLRRTRCTVAGSTACIAGRKRAAKRLDVGEERSGSSNGRWRISKSNVAIARHDVERRAATNHADMHRRVGNVVRVVLAPPSRNRARGHAM